MAGPLSGCRVVELAGIGPAPFAGMVLADAGADVITVDRPPYAKQAGFGATGGVLARGKRSVAVDLKHPEGPETVLRLIEGADALIEGFRPGVTERLGLGPAECHARNRALVYGRMTGFGQSGPLAHAAGHDINYIALGGVLASVGRAGQPPTPPLNLVGDFGGGGMLLAFGVLAALVHARATGEGQTVDAAMVEGSALLMAPFFPGRAQWPGRGRGMLDSGSHFYDAYETSDGKWVSVGAIEPQFYAELLDRLGIDPDELGPQMDPSTWPAAKERIAAVFRTRTRDEWCELLEGTDACFAPALELSEVAEHAHNRAREAYVDVDGQLQPAPAPRFDRTVSEVRETASTAGAHTDEVLVEAGFQEQEIQKLRDGRAVA